MQTLPNNVVVPTNSDPYNLTADLAVMGNTTNVIIPVFSQIERDAIPNLTFGTTVRRMDKAGRTEYWTGSQWLPDGAQVEIGQGTKVPILKALEVAVTLNSFSVGQIVFPTAFPTKLVSVSLMRLHSTAGPLTFSVVSGTTTKSMIEFVASGATSVASTTIYVYYQAWGY